MVGMTETRAPDISGQRRSGAAAGMKVGCWALGFILLLVVCGCSRQTNRQGYSPRVVPLGQPVPKGGGRYKLGSPYVIAGTTYVPRHDPN